MWGKVTMSVARRLAQLNMIPFQIKVRPGLLAAVLQPLADALHFKLRVTSRLRMLDEVKAMFLELSGR